MVSKTVKNLAMSATASAGWMSGTVLGVHSG